jgi:tetratricopeptide (TPR) repeat protein
MLTQWLLPIRQAPVYSIDSKSPWPLLFVVVASALLVHQRRRFPALLAAWAFFAVAVAPVLLYSARGQPLYLHDYHAYLPTLGFCVVAGAALARFPLPAAALAAGLGLVANAQARVWRDSTTLWRSALAVDPDSRHALFRLSLALQTEGRWEEAVVPAERLYALDPAKGEKILAAARAGLVRAR